MSSTSSYFGVCLLSTPSSLTVETRLVPTFSCSGSARGIRFDLVKEGSGVKRVEVLLQGLLGVTVGYSDCFCPVKPQSCKIRGVVTGVAGFKSKVEALGQRKDMFR